MAIHIALVGRVEDCGPDKNLDAVVTIIGDIEDPIILQEMESAGEELADGVVINWEEMEDHSYYDKSYSSSLEDYKAAMQTIEALLILDPFREAFEHLFNEARRLGTSLSDKHFSGIGIKARRQATQYQGDPTVMDEDSLDEEPHRRTHSNQ